MARRAETRVRALRALTQALQRSGARVALRGPADALRMGRIARTLPPGAVVVETMAGGEIALPDGRRAAWRCGRGGVNVFETIADRNRRQKLWRLSKRTKDAIHHACGMR